MILRLFFLCFFVFVGFLFCQLENSSACSKVNCNHAANKEISVQTTPQMTKKKSKVPVNLIINKQCLGYKHWSSKDPYHPSNFKLWVQEDLFCEYKNETKDSDVKIHVNSKEIDVHNNKFTVKWFYDWTYGGICYSQDTKEREFIIEDNVESIDLKFSWLNQTRNEEHIIVEKKYAQTPEPLALTQK